MLRELAGTYELFIKTEIPASYFSAAGLTLHHLPEPLDRPCVQSNFTEVDSAASFHQLHGFYQQADRKLEAEVRWLKSENIGLVVSDIAPLALKAAAEAGIPGILVANFTWHDIYSHFPEAPRYQSLLNRLAEEYRLATLHCLPQLHLPPHPETPAREVGLLSLKGTPVRERLRETLPPRLRDRTWIFIYTGQYDASVMQWEALGKMEDYLFLSRDALDPRLLPPNVVTLDETWDFADLIASSALVVTKGGYSTLATAFHHGLPVLCGARPDFREFEAVRACLEERGTGMVLEPNQFLAGDWEPAIKKALKMTVKDKIKLNGEREIRQAIDHLFGTASIPTQGAP